jgi:hypothetical protein
VLPASLENLKLYVYDDWSINGWAPDLLALFERKPLEFPGMEGIWVEYWIAGDRIDDDQPSEKLKLSGSELRGWKLKPRKQESISKFESMKLIRQIWSERKVTWLLGHAEGCNSMEVWKKLRLLAFWWGGR